MHSILDRMLTTLQSRPLVRPSKLSVPLFTSLSLSTLFSSFKKERGFEEEEEEKAYRFYDTPCCADEKCTTLYFPFFSQTEMERKKKSYSSERNLSQSATRISTKMFFCFTRLYFSLYRYIFFVCPYYIIKYCVGGARQLCREYRFRNLV